MSVSGTSARSASQIGTPGSKKPKSVVPPHKRILCRTCGEPFDDEQALVMHKLWAMKVKGTHPHCTVCAMEFQTMEAQKKHMLEMHPHDQDLVCPGCQTRFVRLSGYMKHFEHEECPEIRRMQVDSNRAQKLSFAHELEKRSGSQFGDYFPNLHPSVQSALSHQTKSYMAHPSFFKPEDFPGLKEIEGAPKSGANQSIASSTDVSSLTNAFSGANLSSPIGPTSSNITTAPSSPNATAPSASQEVTDIHSPYHNNFNVMNYYNKFTRKFKCPNKSCAKNFGSANALLHHMKSSISHYNAKLQCPGCLNWFKDASSLTAHSESETNRCQIRYSENYRVFLDQLTGGMADVTGINQDKTIQYQVSNEAVIKFGNTRHAKKAVENFMEQEDAERQEMRSRNPVW
ncbi:C2H2 finger domain-containing protein [Colletotrichum karsti]|uniref:C2H2 finger domain-containing protein n=1 Tax=Colletotrichum karsti TaxID=1095194 RepID=A0A9P6LQ22_9PEZI|nr:C2H2 finger domain-containing protein [Colletotrichum karsti]KAF9881116.1 C2H2 finger domain-containing protein [Colletotrichum karsti]